MIWLSVLPGFYEGAFSFLTPQSLLLLPLILAAAGAGSAPCIIAIAAGIGLSMLVPGWCDRTFGWDADLTRDLTCVVLLLAGLCLLSRGMTRRFAFFTGGVRDVFGPPRVSEAGSMARQWLLAVLVGINWIPHILPMVGKTTLLSMDDSRAGVVAAAMAAFGIGAAIPWLVLGQFLRRRLIRISPLLTDGPGGRRLLGMTLIAVGVLGLTGLDLALVQALAPVFPAWARQLAMGA